MFRRDGNAGSFIDRVINRSLNAWDSAYHGAALQAYSSNPWAVMGTMGLNAIQTTLNTASYVPVVGSVASFGNAYLHGIRGNYAQARESLYTGGSGVLLGGGLGATFTKTAFRSTVSTGMRSTFARTSTTATTRLGRDLTYAGSGTSALRQYASSVAPRAQVPTTDIGFKLAKHGDMPTPRPYGTQSHHGVMSAWMKKHYTRYDPNKAPAILMPTPNHQKTFGVYNKWRASMKKQMGGKFDWGKVSEKQMRSLSEEMFDAAGVPVDIRTRYWEWYTRMKKAVE